MKILLATDTWTPTVNGVVTSATTLRAAMERRGHEVRVLTLSGTMHTTTAGGVTALGSMDAGRVYPGARLRRPAVGGALQALEDWRPDVVHTQCEFSTFGPARQIARAVGAPVVHTYHTVYEDYTHYFSPSRRMGRHAAAWFSRFVCQQADAVIAPTQKIQRLLTGYGITRPVRVIPTGIELSRFGADAAPALAAWLKKARQRGPALLYLGRMAKEKNLSELVKALAQLPDATLLLVGDGPERCALEALATELGVADRVLFTGMIPPEDTPAYYAAADYFVSASTSEAQGLTYLEAMAAGLPLLCRADPCLSALVVPSITGWQYHTQEELLRCARTLPLGHRREAMGRAARARAAHYSADVFGQQVEALYRELLTGAEAAPRRVPAREGALCRG